MFLKRIICLAICCLPLSFSIAQQQSRAIPFYPQDYFRNPLDIPIFLAGNFGECRPGHFHSGIDIKTTGKENLPVHAAADGYISRIKMEKGGFGHGLYITHPNGYTTLYAHLNDFAPAVQQYVRRTQYEKQQWNIDIALTPSQFPVKKGQLIAFSGNTGASTAPHLHFEIRDTKTEHPLNPEQFGLPIIDNVAPVPIEVAFYKGNIYSNPPHILGLTKKGDSYHPTKFRDETLYTSNNDTVITEPGIIGVGINVDDYMNGSDNSLTFYTATLLINDSPQCRVTLDNIGYDETRYINAYTDYTTKKRKGKWLQLMFQQPGNKLDVIYKHFNPTKGRINLAAGSLHKVDIIIADDKGNESKINFYINPALPAQADTTQQTGTVFYANKSNKFSDLNVMFTLDERQLYDDVRFVFNKRLSAAYSDKYDLHYPDVPLHHYFDLMVKPTRVIPFDLRKKMILMYSDGKEESGSAAAPVEDGWYKTAVRAFGTYWLDVDTTAPVTKAAYQQGVNLSHAKQILLTAKDEQTSVKKFNGYIDDKWVCFEQHGNSFFYKFDEHCPKGKHTLLFKAEDENGNSSTYTLNFIR